MKAQIKIKAPVIDMYSTDWEFDGKKGTTHFVVIYDYETHQAERLTLPNEDISLFNVVSTLSLPFPRDLLRGRQKVLSL